MYKSSLIREIIPLGRILGYELGEGRILTRLAKAPERQRHGKRIREGRGCDCDIMQEGGV